MPVRASSGFLGVGLLVGVAALALAGVTVDDATRPVVLPVLVSLGLAAWTWTALPSRNAGLPILDIGALFIFIVLLYTVVPLLGYLAGGLAFSLLSDSRLVPYNPSPEEMGAFAWRYVTFLASFCLSYVAVRLRNTDGTHIPQLKGIDHGLVASVLFWLALGFVYLLILWVATGFSFYSSYEDLQGTANLYSSLPLIVQQASHNVAGIVTVLKLALLVVLYASWAKPYCRILIVAWIAIELGTSLLTLGARTPLLLFLIANVLLYHRFVGRIGLRTALTLVLLLSAGVLGFGFIRDYLDASSGTEDVPILSASNEFQSLFATGYDITQRYSRGDLSVPWQIYVADFLRLFPRQILPFDKIDPNTWYLQVIGREGTGVGFPFGTIAEGSIGGGWVGLVARGAFLGVLFALLHAWYLRRQGNFYVTLSYVWLCLHSYYCIRGSTLYILVWIEYRLIPAIVLIAVTKVVLTLASANARESLGDPGKPRHV